MSHNVARISGTTRAVALFGYPVAHSLSPRMHNAAFAAAGLDYVYIACEVRPEEVEPALRGVRALNFAGINLTVPHKQTVLPLLDELTEEARAIGAVNTAANRNGRWVGTNTDAAGFRHSLEVNGLYRPGMRAVMLGAGGAARAILYVLSRVATRVDIFNRTPRRAEELMASLAPYRGNCRWEAFPLEPRALASRLGEVDLLVNTTSAGMHPNDQDCPVPEEVALPSQCGVVDIVYAPPKTRLLQRAERAGCKTVGGHAMLLYQAVDAFRFWTGVEPEVAAMDEALRNA